MTPSELNTELTTDPMGLGYAAFIASGNDQAIADLRNDKTRGYTAKVFVPIHTLLVWSAPSIRGKLQTAANDPTSPMYSVALSALDLLRGSGAQSLDTVANSSLLDALVAGGIATSSERTALDTSATVPASREEVQSGVGAVCTANEIAHALRG